MTDPGDEHLERVLPAPASVPGITGAGDILTRLIGELDIVRRSKAAARAEADELRRLETAKWSTYSRLEAEERDLLAAIARAGGGFDNDYYHRRRERAVGRIVQNGIHTIVEDGE